MKIEEQFSIQAPPDAVWAFLIDPERVAAALPGAEISEKIDGTTFKGGMAVRVGPVSANYRGTVSFELDDAARSAVVHAKAQGMAGMGSADMRMTSRVREVGDNETQVTVEADVTISGILAQFGRGMIEQVSKKMFQDFSAAVKSELEAG
jgi:carbon monoxide dehydrogenase subunit G